MIDWPLFVTRIQSANRILLTSHVRPDGDSIGSEMAMTGILRSLGKDVRAINAHPVPPSLRFLDPQGTIKDLPSLTVDEQEWLAGIDCVMVLDTSSWAQLNDMGKFLKRPGPVKNGIVRMVLDHHQKSDDLGAEDFVDSNAEATGTLVFAAAKALGVPITKAIADPIFVAIITDTGWLRFSSTKPETYRTIAELVEAGVVPSEMYRMLHEQDSLARMRLIGRAMSNIEAYLDGSLLMTHLMLADFEAVGAIPQDSEDVINMLLQVAGSQVAIILVEQQPSSGRAGGMKLSFRSRCHVDCSKLAAQFNGGGHRAAAGGRIDLSLGEAKTALLAAVMEAINR